MEPYFGLNYKWERDENFDALLTFLGKFTKIYSFNSIHNFDSIFRVTRDTEQSWWRGQEASNAK